MQENNESKNVKISKIEIDPNACIGCGTCMVLAEKAFDFNENGHSVPKSTFIEVDTQTLIKAASSCPVHAISLYD